MTAEYDPGMIEVEIEDALPSPLFLDPNKREVQYERRQCRDEGRDVSQLEERFDALLDADAVTQEELHELLDASRELPVRPDFPYHEPSSLDGIRDARPEGPRQIEGGFDDLDDPYDVIYGGWLGAVAGCFLGKPVQGWSRDKIHSYLKASNQFPLSGYMRSDDELAEEYDIYNTVESSDAEGSMFVNDVPHMPVDDDIDYVAVGLGILDEYGVDFEPVDVANYWLQNLPVFNTYTAERVAYRNLLNLVMPPESATLRNPYREHVGALIRADMWGFVALGDPEQAAEYAWRDASVSHVKNGIYGEMFAAAMMAAAPFESDPRRLLEIGLSEIPAECRLAEAVSDVIEWRENGLDYEEAVERVHERWDESNQFDWVHTISNAEVLAIGLLWGEGDFGESLCLAVQAGFDTDSHAATLGSILGLLHGAEALPNDWTDPLDDTVETSLVSYQRQPISDLAAETLSLVRETGE
ncbi:ADP-ribosylglycohydrolase family protein [Halostella sp. PRR32]|uniref:ADP-ribosylglycohydrolase family protein n=1 Tax=Halostella sp. PRR32 TaxID=3098147 RepID=UPI002B1DD244|nr:ADP-ribosylglycohydrolase family protein [Halostella sp. PRR32]